MALAAHNAEGGRQRGVEAAGRTAVWPYERKRPAGVGTPALQQMMAFVGRRRLLVNGFPFDYGLGERFAQGRPPLRSE
jgi:hypothetical protein